MHEFEKDMSESCLVGLLFNFFRMLASLSQLLPFNSTILSIHEKISVINIITYDETNHSIIWSTYAQIAETISSTPIIKWKGK